MPQCNPRTTIKKEVSNQQKKNEKRKRICNSVLDRGNTSLDYN
jgi:hypothetical protein